MCAGKGGHFEQLLWQYSAIWQETFQLLLYIYFKLPQIRTSKFRKVLQQYTGGYSENYYMGFVGNLLLFTAVKEFENPSRIDKVIAISSVYYFFGTLYNVYLLYTLWMADKHYKTLYRDSYKRRPPYHVNLISNLELWLMTWRWWRCRSRSSNIKFDRNIFSRFYCKMLSDIHILAEATNAHTHAGNNIRVDWVPSAAESVISSRQLSEREWDGHRTRESHAECVRFDGFAKQWPTGKYFPDVGSSCFV